MSRAENAVMRLYEDSSLRDGMTDEPAARLLRWAEDQLIALDESGIDDSAFEAGVIGILASVRQINSKVDRTLSGDLPPDGLLAQSADSADVTTIDEMTLVEQLIAGASGQVAEGSVSSEPMAAGQAAPPTETTSNAPPDAALPNPALPNAASMTEPPEAPQAPSANTSTAEASAVDEDPPPPQNFLAGWAQRLRNAEAPEPEDNAKPPESEDDELA